MNILIHNVVELLTKLITLIKLIHINFRQIYDLSFENEIIAN